MFAGLTIRGRCLLAAGIAAAVCSLLLDERDLLRIAAFVTALPLLAVVLATRTRFVVEARREVEPARVSVDSEAHVRLSISGRGRLPLSGLELSDEIPRALGARPRFVLDRIRRAHPTTVRYSLWAELRGIHHIGPLRTRVGDPFGLSEFERELVGQSRLVVVPRVVPLVGFPTGAGLGTGDNGPKRLRAGHGDDDTMVREYRHGDDMRRVHWKSTAHRDELMVRVEERPWQGGITVLLDRRAAAHRGSGARSSLEWAVSAAASICLHLHRHGQRVRLVTENGQVLVGGISPADDSHGEDAVLDSLAAVRPSTQRDLVHGTDPGEGQELIAVLGATTTAGVTELSRLRARGSRSMALLLDVPSWNTESTESGVDCAETAERLRGVGWTVATVDGPQSALPAVWSRLCRESPRASSPEAYTGVPG